MAKKKNRISQISDRRNNKKENVALKKKREKAPTKKGIYKFKWNGFESFKDFEPNI